jgi:hypothetical protein
LSSESADGGTILERCFVVLVEEEKDESFQLGLGDFKNVVDSNNYVSCNYKGQYWMGRNRRPLPGDLAP